MKNYDNETDKSYIDDCTRLFKITPKVEDYNENCMVVAYINIMYAIFQLNKFKFYNFISL